MWRSSHWKCSVRKGVFRNFAKFAGKHLCQRLFFFCGRFGFLDTVQKLPFPLFGSSFPCGHVHILTLFPTKILQIPTWIQNLHTVCLTIWHHLFLEFCLVNTWFFAHWRHQRAVTRLENIRQLNIRRYKYNINMILCQII